MIRTGLAVLIFAAVASAAAPPSTAPTPAATPAASPSPADGAPAPGVFGRIRGTVFDVARVPRAGILVQLVSRDHQGLLRVTGTDASGQYLFQDLPAGRYDIEVGAEGLAHEKKAAIEVRPPFQNIVDFRLGGGSGTGSPGAPAAPASRSDGAAPGGAGASSSVTVRGRLVDQGRRPVDEVSVTFVAVEGGRAFQSFSGEDGGFAIEGVPPGRYRVLVTSPGHIALSLPSVSVMPQVGLDLSLTLVDYPLNDKGRRDSRLPREEPRPAPSPSGPSMRSGRGGTDQPGFRRTA
jgi:hypothetical protein